MTNNLEKIEKDFCFVECWWPGKKNRWERINITQIEDKVRKPSNNIGCCTSVQRYRSAMSGDEDEIHMSDFWIDIDCEGNVPQALEDSRKIFNYFHSMKMGYEYPRVFFSGKKGFHIQIPWQIFNIRPDKNLNDKFKVASEHIGKVTRVRTIDPKIYSKKRQLRLFNAKHPDTGLYKHEIPAEIFNEISLNSIMEMAVEPSGYKPQNDPCECEMAMKWWGEILERHEEKDENQRLAPSEPIKKINGKTPVCIQYILDHGISRGKRNKATMNLVCFYKDQGISKRDCTKIMTKWCKNHFANEGNNLKERLANASAVITTVYNNKNKYFFACSYMHGCMGGEDQIPCSSKEECEFINKPEDQVPKKIPEIDLAKASAGKYMGVEVKVPIHVVAKEDSPYALPTTVHFACTLQGDEERDFCADCPLSKTPDRTFEYRPSAEHRQTLNLIQNPDAKVYSTLKSSMRIPDRCRNLNLKRGNIMQNIVMIHMNPMLKDGMTDNEYDDDLLKSATYTHRAGYYMGHEVEPNRDYFATMRTYNHPKDQKIAHLISKIEPAASSVDTFNPDTRLLERLKIFQVKPNQTVEAKMNEIHADLENNVHMILNRGNEARVMDLFYHTVLRFKLGSTMVEKGWLELLVVGDSGQGKSALAKRLRWHYQLGDWVSGESSGRTGLVYSMQKNEQKQWYVNWGKIPQNDRGAVIIDEFSGIDKKEWGEFTELRSSGIAECNKIKQQKTTARTRLMCITNPIRNKDLSEYRFGIEALQDLYLNPADGRRVDVCVGFKEGDVDSKVLNTLETKTFPHKYTSDLCRNLVLWTWSRKVNQIYFDQDSVKKIYSYGEKLANKYGGTKVLVVSASDQKFKLARLAVAVAARVFSTDSKMENLIVKPEHVKYAASLMQKLYDSEALRYDAYVREYREVSIAADDIIEEVRHLFNSVTGREGIDGLIKYFSSSSIYTRYNLESIYDMCKADQAKLLRELMLNDLIRSTHKGLERTGLFLRVLDKLDAETNSKKNIIEFD